MPYFRALQLHLCYNTLQSNTYIIAVYSDKEVTMKATKYTGVKYHDAKDNTRTFYIQYKSNGRVKREKIGTKDEGITPMYCKKLRDQILVKLRLGENAPSIGSNKKTKLFKEVSDEYFNSKELKTKSKLQSLYNVHLSTFNNEPITYFDKKTIDEFVSKKRKEVSAKTNRPLSEQTIKNIIILLSAILHYAKEEGYISNLDTIIKHKNFKIKNVRDRFLSKDEILTLYSEIETSPLLRKRDRLILFTKIALTTGARLNTILSIKGKDINRTNKTLKLVNHKSNREYTAYLTNEVMALIPVLEPQQKLIDVKDSKQIQRPLQRILNKLFNIGLKPEDRNDRVVIHTLRHTFASHLAINGTPIQTIMKLMDHSDIQMTLRYSKLMPNSGRSEVENLYA